MMASLILPSGTLLLREIVRFFRQKNRVIGAVGSPLILWVLMGNGLSSSFRPPSMPENMSAVEYFFPGTMTLIILFTSIFSTISMIEDRREGFLQSVLVAPISRSAMVLGKILGGVSVALVQGILFLLFAPLIGIKLNLISLGLSIGVIFLLAFALTGLGFVIAWRMDSTQGFHAIMNLFLIPMWLLSGAFFPASKLPMWLSWIMTLNPLTYGVAALRRCLYGANTSWVWDLPPLGLSVTITLLFGLMFFVLSIWMVGKRRASA